MGLKSVQIIADDQTEVASKLQTLIDTYDVSSTEVKTVEISPFGALKFLISLTYADSSLKTLEILSSKLGISVLAPKIKVVAQRALSTTIGLKAAFVDSYKYYRKLTTSLGLTVSFALNITTKITGIVGLSALVPVVSLVLSRALSTTVGLVASMDFLNIVRCNSFTNKTGLKITWRANLNGVEIEPLV